MKVQPFSETKDDSIGSLLRAVGSAAVSAKIEVVDHWDADRYAIGFHRIGSDQPLLYVTTWRAVELRDLRGRVAGLPA